MEKFRVTPYPDGTYVYRGIWEDANGLFILMDDYQTTLRQHIQLKFQLNELQWLQLMLGIAERLAPPHSENICHGDLCPSNGIAPLSKLISKVLVDHHTDYEFDPQKVHLTDFGIAHIVSLPNDTGGINIVPGCLQYLAPEFRNFQIVNATTMSDMWAVGYIGYEMCLGLGLTPEAEWFQEIEAHIAGKPLNLWRIPERFGPNVQFVIQGCMESDPAKRITAARLVGYLRSLLDLMRHGMKDTIQNKSFLNQKWR